MGLNLTNQYISASFQNLLQLSGSDQVTDGLGNRKTSLAITSSHAIQADNATTSSYSDFAVTASYAINSTPQVSASYAISASHAEQADNATNATTASYVISASYSLDSDKLDGKQGSEYVDLTSSQGISGFKNFTDGGVIQINTNGYGLNIPLRVSDGGIYDNLTVNELFNTDWEDILLRENVKISGSIYVTGDITGSVQSASYATTASYAIYAETAGNAGTWDGQYSGSAGITGSLRITSGSAYNWLTPTAVLIKGQSANIILEGTANANGIFRSNQDSYFQKQGAGRMYFDNNVGDVVFQASGSIIVTDPFEALDGITGSLLGTASYAIEALSSSYATYAETAGTATTSQYSDNTVVYGKNLSGGTIEKGTPLYFTGSGTSGNIVGVYPADASNPARMPAAGVAGEQMLDEAEGVVLLDGFINGVDTTGFQSGQQVYVGVGGGYQATRPTGSNNLVQGLGYIEKVAVNGSGVIRGAGRANDVPNIQQGYVWVGGAGDIATTIPTSSLTTEWDGTFTGDASITGSLNVSGSFDVTGVEYNTANNLSVTDVNGNEVLKVGGLLANKRQTALYVSGGMQVVLPTYQSRFEILGLGGNTIIGGGNIGSNDSTGQYSAGIVGGNGGVLQVADNFNNNDFGIAGQMQLWGYLGDWTGPGIYSNDPGGNYPTIVGFQDNSTWTDGRVTFLTPIETRQGIYLTGSINQTAGSTTLNGTTIVNGNFTNNLTAPGTNSQKDILSVSGAQTGGVNFDNFTLSLQDYPAFGLAYQDGFFFESWDSYGYNHGAGIGLSGMNVQMELAPSGSGYSRYGRILIQDSQTGESNVEIRGTNIDIGTVGYTNQTNIGKVENPLVLKGLNIQATGSLKVSGSGHTVNGDIVQQGYIESNFSAPGTNQEKAFYNINGSQVAGRNFNRVFYGQADYPSYGTAYADYFAIEYYDGFGYNYGSEFDINGSNIQLLHNTSGSGDLNYVRLRDDFAGTTRLTNLADDVVFQSRTDIEFDAFNGNIIFSSSLGSSIFVDKAEFNDVVQLNQQDPLPTGALGQLAVSGSGLYFHNGTSWNLIS